MVASSFVIYHHINEGLTIDGSRMATFFNEFFGVTTDHLDAHGAFNISIINDMLIPRKPFEP